MKKPNKQTDPAILRVLLDGFVEDYEAMEAHVSKVECHRMELVDQIKELKGLLAQALDSHHNGKW